MQHGQPPHVVQENTLPKDMRHSALSELACCVLAVLTSTDGCSKIPLDYGNLSEEQEQSHVWERVGLYLWRFLVGRF